MIYAVFLRGINVGGHRKILMADLRDTLRNSGFEKVSTYIQSGNIVLETHEEDKGEIQRCIESLIYESYGFHVSVVVKTKSDIEIIIQDCPFEEEEKEKSYFALLSEAIKSSKVDFNTLPTYPGESYHIINDCLYFYSSVGYGKAKFNLGSMEKKLNVIATARNYKTMIKMVSLMAEREAGH